MLSKIKQRKLGCTPSYVLERDEWCRRQRTGKTREEGRSLLDKQRQNFTGIKQNLEHVQEYQQGVRRLLSEVQQKVQVQQVAGREELENLNVNRPALAKVSIA